MTTREWKVGDRVTLKPEFSSYYPDYIPGKVYDVVELDGKDPGFINEVGPDYFFALNAHEVFDVLEDNASSELEAIERDMADLFVRMRAAIERLK